MEKANISLAVDYCHEAIPEMSEGEVGSFEFAKEGLVSILEVIYPCILPHEVLLYHMNYFTVVYSYSPESDIVGKTNIHLAEAQVPMPTEIVNKGLTYIGNIQYGQSLLFVGAEQIEYVT